jgi:DNA polymerase-3 subunit gamma/tau
VRPIIEGVQCKPAASKYKIFIIDECHMLTPAAWNALLKTLEEPPPYVRFIFATTEGDKLLATIISRCQRFDLRRIQTHQIAARLRYICGKEGIDATEDALLAIARGAEGGMRDALSSLDQLIAFTGDKITEEDALGVFGLVSRKSLEDLAGAILTGDAAAILRAVESFDSAGKDMRRLAGELMQHFRNLLVCQTLGGNAAGIEATPDQVKVLQEQAKLCPASRLFRVTDQLAEMQDKLRYVLSVRTLIEMTLLRAARVATVASIEEVLRAVRELAPQSAASPAAASPAAVSKPMASPVAASKPAAAPAVAPKPAASPVQAPKPAELSADERQKILDDDKVNDLLKAFPGSKITDLR